MSEQKLLHCPLCSCFYVAPVTLNCGHTLCKTCILSGSQGKGGQDQGGGDQNPDIDCKLCGSKNHINKLCVNVLITQLMQKWFPREYESEVKKLEDAQGFRLQGEQRKVVETLSDVLKNSPFNFTALKWRSQALFQMGMSKEALKDANLACVLRPFLACVFHQRARILVAMDRHLKAAVSFARSLALDSTNEECNLELYSCLSKLFSSESAELDKEVFLERFQSLNTSELTSKRKVCSDAATDNQNEIAKQFQKRTNPDKTSNGTVKSAFLEKRSVLKRPLEGSTSRKDSYNRENASFAGPANCRPKCPKVAELDPGSSYNLQESTRNKEDLACQICYSVLFQPVTTNCGHTFCRDCLQRSLDSRPECPYCRQSLNCGAVRNTEVTSVLREIAQKIFPDDYAEREKSYTIEKARWKAIGVDDSVDVPIFVCMVAFPSLKYPLHIFEPRYRLMIRRCVELGSRMFGMCASDPDKEFSDYGTMLYIERMDILPDGRSIIQTTARRRFRVISRTMSDGYNTAKVEWLEDEPPKVKEIEVLNADCGKCLEIWINSLTRLQQTCVTNAIGPMPPLEESLVSSPNGPSWLWWALAATPLHDKEKLSILAMTSLAERLQSIRRFLALLIRMRYAEH